MAIFAGCALAGSAWGQQGEGVQDVWGVWWVTRYSPKIEIIGGGDIPYNDKGQAEYRKNIASLKDGSITDEARRVCVPDGIPRLLGNPYPFLIIPARGHIVMTYELNHVIRIIIMDQPQVSAEELEIAPYYSGHSVGHWEGDTLVIETAGYNDQTFLDATGAPHSDQMTTVERIRRISGAKQLEDVVTVSDPEYLSRQFTARFVYDAHPDVRIDASYNCGDPHRDISHIPGVTEARRARGL
ncbi:MAG TPA: hypothetical protein VGN55_19105 [Xanthobacteraceae bacterium]